MLSRLCTMCWCRQSLPVQVKNGRSPHSWKLSTAPCPHAGFHEFAEFVADDVGTLDSGLNSMVLANNSEMVLMPVNEPTFGTKR